MAPRQARNRSLVRHAEGPGRCATSRGSSQLLELVMLVGEPYALSKPHVWIAPARVGLNVRSKWRSRYLQEWRPDRDCGCRAKASRVLRVVLPVIFTW